MFLERNFPLNVAGAGKSSDFFLERVENRRDSPPFRRLLLVNVFLGEPIAPYRRFIGLFVDIYIELVQ